MKINITPFNIMAVIRTIFVMHIALQYSHAFNKWENDGYC